MQEKSFLAIVIGGITFSAFGVTALDLAGYFGRGPMLTGVNLLLASVLYAPGAYLGLFVLDQVEKRQRP